MPTLELRDRSGPSPRTRGSQVIYTLSKSSAGPSPRTRGKPVRRRPVRRRPGSIPANAGEAAGGHGGGGAAGVHPRERGGSGGALASDSARQGPSPRTRGKLNRISRQRRPLGSIPANAGEAGEDGLLRTTGRVHPRERGEAPPTPQSWREKGVHPRERGGSSLRSPRTPATYGPSPRTRGKPRPSGHRQVAGGSIPANAGEARGAAVGGDQCGVHPRERGGSQCSTSKPAP